MTATKSPGRSGVSPVPATSATPGSPGLGVVSLNGAGDGIAYVARLLHRACTEVWGGEPLLVELAPASPAGVTLAERSRFVARVLASGVRGEPDWWIFNHLGIAQTQNWIPRPLRRPYAVFLNGIEVWDPALAPSRRAALRNAALRISISYHTARRAAAILPEIGEIVPCPLGLLPSLPPRDEEVDAALLERISPESVLIVGRMSASERYKGHDQLIDCWPSVAERVPGAQLVVAGRGDDVDRLRRRAAEAGVADHVLFAGFVSDATLHHLLRRTAAFAMPSRGEGFGLVYLQAMEAGIPCVGSTADAAGDIIVHGETGMLVDPDDREALGEALVRLLRDRELRGRMGEAGRRRFEAEFTFERFRDRLVPILARTFGTVGRRSG